MCDEQLQYEVISLRAAEDGDRVFLRVKAMGLPGERSSKTYALRVEEYAVLPFQVRRGMMLSTEQVGALEAAAQSSGAYGRGLNILGYGANSAKTLQRKLVQKGYDADAAQRAVDTLSERGYLQEERDAVRMAGQILRRGRGLRRILQELRAKGYGDAALRAVSEAFGEEDFVALCADVARKKVRCRPTEREEMQKLAAYLQRCGFESADIRQAMRLAWDDRVQEV